MSRVSRGQSYQVMVVLGYLALFPGNAVESLSLLFIMLEIPSVRSPDYGVHLNFLCSVLAS